MKYLRNKLEGIALHSVIMASLLWFNSIVAQSQSSEDMIPENMISYEDIYRHYPLDSEDILDLKNGDSGTINGTIETTNGWYPGGTALRIKEPNSFIDLQNFVPNRSTAPKGFSISFWTKVDQVLGSPTGSNSALPYLDSDQRDQIFYARTGLNTSDKTLFGMRRIRDRFVLNRYVSLESGTKNELEFWLWDPTSLKTDTGGTDWHFITIVYRWAGDLGEINEDYPSNMTQVYVGTPDGEIHCRANYFAPQDLSTVREWGLGNPHGQAIEYIDDFMVFSSPLSKGQVGHYFKTAHNFKTTYKADLDSSSPVGDELDNKQYHVLNRENKCLSPSDNLEYEWLDIEGGDSSTGYPQCALFKTNQIDDSDQQNIYTFSSPNGLTFLDLDGYGYDQSFKNSEDPAYLDLFEIDSDNSGKKVVFKKRHLSLRPSFAQSLWLVDKNNIDTFLENHPIIPEGESAKSASHTNTLEIVLGTGAAAIFLVGVGVATYKFQGNIKNMFSRSRYEPIPLKKSTVADRAARARILSKGKGCHQK